MFSASCCSATTVEEVNMLLENFGLFDKEQCEYEQPQLKKSNIVDIFVHNLTESTDVQAVNAPFLSEKRTKS